MNIPVPRFRLPVLGDILSIDAAKPTQRELRMAEELGPIFERKILGHRLVVVSGADLVAELNDESRFARFLALPHRKLRALGGDGLFTAFNSEPNWAAAHRILMPGFSRESMQRYHHVMTGVTAELVEHWKARSDTLIDVGADLDKVALENMARAGFGYSFDSFAESARSERSEFVDAIGRVLAQVNSSSNDLPFMRIFRRGEQQQYQRDLAYVSRIVDDVIEARSALGDTRHDDLLDLMLHTPDPDSGVLLDKVNIRHQVLTFLVAGNETTAGTLAFALYFLASTPDVARKVRAEVDAQHPSGGEMKYEDIARLRFTRRVVDETLRLWPSAPGYFRKARADTSLGDGLHPMKAGEWVFVLTRNRTQELYRASVRVTRNGVDACRDRPHLRCRAGRAIHPRHPRSADTRAPEHANDGAATMSATTPEWTLVETMSPHEMNIVAKGGRPTSFAEPLSLQRLSRRICDEVPYACAPGDRATGAIHALQFWIGRADIAPGPARIASAVSWLLDQGVIAQTHPGSSGVTSPPATRCSTPTTGQQSPTPTAD